MEELLKLHQDGVFLRREALAYGYDDRDLRAYVRRGLLAKVRHGAYVEATHWEHADPYRRHQLQAHAVLRSHTTPLALSHTSAAVEHGIQLYEPDLTRVHVTTLERPIARTTHDVVYHQGQVSETDLISLNGCTIVQAPRAALEAASLTDVRGGVVALDSVMSLGLTTADALQRLHREHQRWPGTRSLQISLRLARHGAESPAESLARHLMWAQHLPEPILQYEVRDKRGRLVGRTDFAWPEYGVLGEIDGMQKYGRLLHPGELPADAVRREKRREDLLRETTGWLMIRLVWADLFTHQRTGDRIREQLERGASLLRRTAPV